MCVRWLLAISLLFFSTGAAVSLAAPADQYDCPALAESKYWYGDLPSSATRTPKRLSKTSVG